MAHLFPAQRQQRQHCWGCNGTAHHMPQPRAAQPLARPAGRRPARSSSARLPPPAAANTVGAAAAAAAPPAAPAATQAAPSTPPATSAPTAAANATPASGASLLSAAVCDGLGETVHESAMYRTRPTNPSTEFGFSRGFEERFELGERIGRGASCTVHEGRDLKTGER